jgi:hypothetical protein
VRKLVALLGYIPRPAVAAGADLAIRADGRLPIILPAGMQFRSGAFPGGTPQVFELTNDTTVHPFLNGWELERSRRPTLTAGPPYALSQGSLLLDPKSNRLKVAQFVLVEELDNESNTSARQVQSVADVTGSDGAKYQSAVFDLPVPIGGSTPVADVQVSTSTQTGTIWQYEVAGWPSGLISDGVQSAVVFDTVQRSIQLNDKIVLDKAGDRRWFSVAQLMETQADTPNSGSATVADSGGTVTSNVSVTSQVTLTVILLDAEMNDPSRREPAAADWTGGDAPNVKVRFGFRQGAAVTSEMLLTLSPGDPMVLAAPVEAPQDGSAPGVFLLEDNDTNGIEISAAIDYVARTLTPAPPLGTPLAAPVEAYGNVIGTTRGEAVSGELLGSGDASQTNQTFALKKNPLTYLPGVDAAQSTLKVYVDGLLWSEAPSFYGAGSTSQIYIVRQDDAGTSSVIFGDPACRLNSGSNVVAYYRYGAGKASPPAGSIQQLGKAFKGVTSVRNPVAAAGGDDAEPAGNMRTYAPRSALLLGRAISLADMEAAAASVGGVRAVHCEWQWNTQRQRPLVQIWYIGAQSLVTSVKTKLRGLSDSVTPIDVAQANSIPTTLSLSIEIDPRLLADNVLPAVRAALMNPDSGLLAPELIGIGQALFESAIFEAVLAVPGAVAVQGLLLNGSAMSAYGVVPGTGNYFDFENGALVLNGKAS